MVLQPKVAEFIDTYEELANYRKNLPEFTQLRAISATSLMRTFGDICFVWDTEEDRVLIVPYNLKYSHEAKEKMDIAENPSSLAIRAVLTEAGLDTLAEPHILDSILQTDNSDSESDEEFFFKYIAVITQFRGTLRNVDQVLWDKNGTPVWIKRNLLHLIFEEKTMIKGKLRDHPQLPAFLHFDLYAFGYLNFR